jgi:hypothetical protein
MGIVGWKKERRGIDEGGKFRGSWEAGEMS